MDINRILTDLKRHREQLDQAIHSLEMVATEEKRGRPPKWITEARHVVGAAETPTRKRGRPHKEKLSQAST